MIFQTYFFSWYPPMFVCANFCRILPSSLSIRFCSSSFVAPTDDATSAVSTPDDGRPDAPRQRTLPDVGDEHGQAPHGHGGAQWSSGRRRRWHLHQTDAPRKNAPLGCRDGAVINNSTSSASRSQPHTQRKPRFAVPFLRTAGTTATLQRATFGGPQSCSQVDVRRIDHSRVRQR